MNFSKKIFIFFMIISSMLSQVAFAEDIENRVDDSSFASTFLKDRSQGFTELSSRDINELLLYNEFDSYTDTNLEYNSAVKELINSLMSVQKLYNQGNVAVAYSEYKKIIGEMTPNDFYYMITAYQLANQGFFSLADIAASKVNDKNIWGNHINSLKKHLVSNTEFTAEEEIFLAQIHTDIVYNNLTEECRSKIAESSKKIKNSDYAAYLEALAYSTQKDYKKALDEIEKAVSLNPSNITYTNFKAETEKNLYKNKDALKTLKKAHTDDVVLAGTKKETEKRKYYILSDTEKKEPVRKYDLAYYFYLNKDYARAINELTLLISRGDTEKAPALLGHIYTLTGKTESAKKVYEKQISKKKNSASAYVGLGNIAAIERNYGLALKYYEQAYKYDSKDPQILVGLAALNKNRNNPKEAEKFAQKALKEAPEFYKTTYINSVFAKNEREAVGYLKKTAGLNPLFAETWLDLAQKAYDASDITEAERYVNNAAFLTKESYRYFYLKYTVELRRFGNTENSATDIKRARKLYSEKRGLGKFLDNI